MSYFERAHRTPLQALPKLEATPAWGNRGRSSHERAASDWARSDAGLSLLNDQKPDRAIVPKYSATLLLGYSAQRTTGFLLILPLVVSTFLIADIDSPRAGIIRVLQCKSMHPKGWCGVEPAIGSSRLIHEMTLLAALHESVFGPQLPIRDVRNSVAIEGEADILRELQFGSD